jgi:hypothetical protein
MVPIATRVGREHHDIGERSGRQRDTDQNCKSMTNHRISPREVGEQEFPEV